MPRGFFPSRMQNFTPWLKPVPAPEVETHDEEPARCIRISEALIPYLLGMLELARYEYKFTGTPEDKLRAVQVFQDLAAAFALEDVCCDTGEDDMYLLRQNPENPCQLEQSTDGGGSWTLAFDYSLCLTAAQDGLVLERYDGDYYDYQKSYDGGETWTTVPDYRITSPKMKNNNLDKTDPACVAAQRVIEWVRDAADIDDEGTFAIVLAGLIQFVLTFVTGGALAPMLITTVVNAIIAFGITAFKAEMDVFDYDTLLCNLKCHADANGEWTLQGYYAVLDQISIDHEGITGFFVKNMFVTLGWVGMNNVAQSGVEVDEECDCGCDEWCYTFDFTATDGEWVQKLSAGVGFGQWSPGQGWTYQDKTNVQAGVTTAHRQVSIVRQFTERIVTRVLAEFDYAGGSFDNTGLTAMALVNGNSTLVAVTRADASTADDQQIDYTNDGVAISELSVTLRSSRDTSAPYTYSGGCLLKRVTLWGKGSNPFGVDNCEEE